jgi:hypothetical protein
MGAKGKGMGIRRDGRDRRSGETRKSIGQKGATRRHERERRAEGNRQKTEKVLEVSLRARILHFPVDR